MNIDRKPRFRGGKTDNQETALNKHSEQRRRNSNQRKDQTIITESTTGRGSNVHINKFEQVTLRFCTAMLIDYYKDVHVA